MQWEEIFLKTRSLIIFISLLKMWRWYKSDKKQEQFWQKRTKSFEIFFSIAFEKGTIFRKCAQNYPEHYPTKQKKSHHSDLANIRMRNEGRFMYKINQGHLTVFCIVFVWLGGPPSPVRIMTQVPWFMYQNQLGPSGSICYPNFAPCFVALYLNVKLYIVKEL